MLDQPVGNPVPVQQTQAIMTSGSCLHRTDGLILQTRQQQMLHRRCIRLSQQTLVCLTGGQTMLAFVLNNIRIRPLTMYTTGQHKGLDFCSSKSPLANFDNLLRLECNTTRTFFFGTHNQFHPAWLTEMLLGPWIDLHSYLQDDHPPVRGRIYSTGQAGAPV